MKDLDTELARCYEEVRQKSSQLRESEVCLRVRVGFVERSIAQEEGVQARDSFGQTSSLCF